MYNWKNDKIRNQYDIQLIAAKNNGIQKFTDEELDAKDLKAKAFQGITDSKVKRMIELAYIVGNLNGLKAADMELEEPPIRLRSAAKAAPAVQKTPAEHIQEERLYVMVCKVKNRQDKITTVTHCVKARNDADAITALVAECGMKNQTLVKSKTVRIYGSDSMQFQFGIGQKELDTLIALGKKNL